MTRTLIVIGLAAMFIIAFAAASPAESGDLIANVRALLNEDRMDEAKALVEKDRAASRAAVLSRLPGIEQVFAGYPKDPKTGKAVVDGRTMELYSTVDYIASVLAESGQEQDKALARRVGALHDKYHLPDAYFLGDGPPAEIVHPIIGEWLGTAAGPQVTYSFHGDGTFVYQSISAGPAGIALAVYDGAFALKGSRLSLTGIRAGSSATTARTPGTADTGPGTGAQAEAGKTLPDRDVDFSLENGNNTLVIPDLADSSKKTFTRRK